MLIKKGDIIYYIVAGALFVLLKLVYRHLETADLTFLLAPTNKIVELMTGFKAEFLAKSGFYFTSLNVVINKSCSSFNFMLISFLAFTYVSVRETLTQPQKSLALLGSMLLAYLLAIVSNSIRIYTAIKLLPFSQAFSPDYKDITHEGIGIITNLTFLLLAYFLLERLLQKKKQNDEVPQKS